MSPGIRHRDSIDQCHAGSAVRNGVGLKCEDCYDWRSVVNQVHPLSQQKGDHIEALMDFPLTQWQSRERARSIPADQKRQWEATGREAACMAPGNHCCRESPLLHMSPAAGVIGITLAPVVGSRYRSWGWKTSKLFDLSPIMSLKESKSVISHACLRLEKPIMSWKWNTRQQEQLLGIPECLGLQREAWKRKTLPASIPALEGIEQVSTYEIFFFWKRLNESSACAATR
ncbi:hypothetical protein QBC35DRAFT_474090 [Podospora australis]|uniref:Uncharacterized protein n=1 Tax=Podospora australis TaxID=1536484 RepID=A0AAN6WTP4_9PEZI|nr:hypothetical protein QBC35DRAFT_474090 [Podospora australis]